MDDPRKNPHDINELVKDFQQGKELAGEELLRIFGCHPNEPLSKFVGKYYDLIRYGKMDYKNKDLRAFISLFADNATLRNKLKPHYQYAETKASGAVVIQKINNIFESVEDEDLIQDLRLILLQQAKRYKVKGKKINFLGYLYNSYRYAVYNYYKSMYVDLLSLDKLVLDNEAILNEVDEYAEVKIEDEWFFEDCYFKDNEELGFNWIHNKTTTEPFNMLSVYERTLLAMYYDKELVDREIAELTGYNENTIFKQRKRIKKKLQEYGLNKEY